MSSRHGDTPTASGAQHGGIGATPTVSVIIPCFNSGQYLERCLRSLIALAGAWHEVLVVDDGSTEDIRPIMERFAPAVRYYRQPNQGPGAARNTGIRETSGAYVRFIDADDWVLPAIGALSWQVDMLNAHPEVGLVYAQALKVTDDGQPFGIRRPSFARRSYVRPGEVELRELLFGNYITTTTSIVRRRVLEQIGGFRTDIIGPEDWDCWLRLAQVSWIGYVDEPVAAYRLHQRSITAHYTPIPWLQMHAGILDRQFVNPQVARRYGSLRPLIDARLQTTAAALAYVNGRKDLARHYAGQALAIGLQPHSWRILVDCLWLVAKSLLPMAVHRPLRQTRRRWRTAMTSAGSMVRLS